MKIIFLKDVLKVGRRGEVKKVSDGYGRNFLIAKGFAEIATNSSIKKFNTEQTLQKEKKGKIHEEFHALKEALTGGGVVIRKKTDEKGHLYSKVTAEEIIEALKKANYPTPDKFNKKIIKIKTQIKTLGEHEAKIHFGKNEEITLKIEIQKLD